MYVYIYIHNHLYIYIVMYIWDWAFTNWVGTEHSPIDEHAKNVWLEEFVYRYIATYRNMLVSSWQRFHWPMYMKAMHGSLKRNTLQYITTQSTHCNTLQHTAPHVPSPFDVHQGHSWFFEVQQTATHWNIMLLISTHCNTLQHTYCNKHTSTSHCIWRPCIALQDWHTAAYCTTPQHTATYTLHHTHNHRSMYMKAMRGSSKPVSNLLQTTSNSAVSCSP